MMFVVVTAGVVLVGALVLAIWARRRFWGVRLRQAEASSVAPVGSLLYAAQNERGRHLELVPLLADWIVRDMLVVEKSGAHLARSRESGSAGGPVWHFTAGQRVFDADGVEQIVLAAMFEGLPQPGQRVTLEREDTAWRERVATAIGDASRAQRIQWGEGRTRALGLKVLIVVAAAIAAPALVVGSFLAQLGPSLTALLFVAGVVVAGVAITIAARPSKSDAERRYRQAVVDLREWVRTTANPEPRLGGWAMIWDLPGPWPGVVPESVVGLKMMDRSFLRADFGDTVPEPFSLG